MMAYRLVKEQRFEPAASQYKGAAEKFTAEYTGPPEQVLPASIASELIAGFATHVRVKGGTLLEVKVWADWTPTWFTRYRVQVVAHGSPALPWALIVGAVIVVGLAVITWKVTSTSWGWTIPLAAIIIGAIVLLGMAKRPKKGET